MSCWQARSEPVGKQGPNGVVCGGPQVADIVAIVVAFPGALLAVAAGAIFGLVTGSLLVWIGTSIGQTVAFMVGRSAFSERLPPPSNPIFFLDLL